MEKKYQSIIQLSYKQSFHYLVTIDQIQSYSYLSTFISKYLPTHLLISSSSSTSLSLSKEILQLLDSSSISFSFLSYFQFSFLKL